MNSYRIHGGTRGTEKISGDSLCGDVKGNGSYYFLYLPVNVYEQSSQREDAGHYFQQQAADLHQRKILYRC